MNQSGKRGFHNWRVLAAASAILPVVMALYLWWADGAWEYGAMPDHGVIRTILFAGSGVLCLGLSAMLARLKRD